MIAVKGECQIIYKCQIVIFDKHHMGRIGSAGQIWPAGRQLKITALKRRGFHPMETACQFTELCDYRDRLFS